MRLSRTPLRVLAVPILAGLVASACVDAASRGARPLPEPDVYVALGDSFASGEGVEPYLAGSGNAGDACHRSRSAYATAVAEATGLSLRFRACSGATIADMFRTQRTPGGGNAVGPQLARGVLGPDVALVTLSIGGNDLGFGPVLRHCVMHFDCFDDTFQDERSLRAWANERLDAIATELETLYGRIRGAAPNARVLVLGYPRIFPAGLPDLTEVECAPMLLISPGEAAEIRSFQDRLDGVMRRAAAAAGVEFVATAKAFEGREPCGEVQPWWIEPLSPVEGSGSMHPSRAGHAAIAELVTGALAG